MTSIASRQAVQASVRVLAGKYKVPDYEMDYDKIFEKGREDNDQARLGDINDMVRTNFFNDNFESLISTMSYLPHRLNRMMEDVTYGMGMEEARDVCSDIARFFLVSDYANPELRGRIAWNDYAALFKEIDAFIKGTAENIRQCIAGGGHGIDAQAIRNATNMFLDRFEMLNRANPFIKIDEDDDDEDKPRMMRAVRASAVLASAASMSRRREIAARAEELTITELEKVQEVAGFLENITVGSAEVMEALSSLNLELVGTLRSGIGSAIDGMKKLPINVREQINAADYWKVLHKLDGIMADLEGAQLDDDGFSQIPAQKEINKCLKEMQRLHRLNPTMRKSGRGTYIALGAGTLAVALLAVGAFVLKDELPEPLRKVIEQGTDFIERQGSRFMRMVPDWLLSPIDSFMDMISTDVIAEMKDIGLDGEVIRYARTQPQEKVRFILENLDPSIAKMMLQDSSSYGYSLEHLDNDDILNRAAQFREYVRIHHG